MATFRRTAVPAHAGHADESAYRSDRVTERRWAFDASHVVALLAGLFYVVIGILALIDLGFSDFPSEATTEVAGLVHTQLWGAVGIVMGLLLLAGAGSIGRGVTTFAAALLVVVGIVVVAAVDDLDATLATDTAYGWTAVVIGVITLLAAIATPSVATRSDRVIDERYDRDEVI